MTLIDFVKQQAQQYAESKGVELPSVTPEIESQPSETPQLAPVSSGLSAFKTVAPITGGILDLTKRLAAKKAQDRKDFAKAMEQKQLEIRKGLKEKEFQYESITAEEAITGHQRFQDIEAIKKGTPVGQYGTAMDVAIKTSPLQLGYTGATIALALAENFDTLSLAISDQLGVERPDRYETPITDAIKDSLDWWERGIEETQAELETPEQRFVAGLSGGVVSLLGAAAIYAVTRNTTLAAATMGTIESSSIYNEAREAGKSSEEALFYFGSSAVGSAYLEKVGLDYIFQKVPGGLVGNIVKKGMTEGFQEGGQQLLQDTVANIGYDKTYSSLTEYGTTLLIGALVGGVGGTILGSSAIIQRDKIKSGLVESGLSSDKAEEILNQFENYSQKKYEELKTAFNNAAGVKEQRLAGLQEPLIQGERPGVEMSADITEIEESSVEEDYIEESQDKKLIKAIEKINQLGTEEIVTENFNPLESTTINPLQRSLGEAQSMAFDVNARADAVLDAFKTVLSKSELKDPKVSEAITERIDSGIPLPEELQKLEPVIAKVRTVQQFASNQLKSKKIIEQLWDDETYVRRIFVQEDGSKPTGEQLAELAVASNDGVKGDLMRLSSGATGYGLSTNSKYYQGRKFKTIAEADTYLKKFGLKVNKNFFNSFLQQFKQLGKTLYNHSFVESLRSQAKQGVKGLVEIYDPVELRIIVEAYAEEYKNVRDNLLNEMRDEKKVEEEKYREMREEAVSEYAELKDDIRTTLEKEDIDVALKDLNLSMGAFRSSLQSDLRESKLKTTDKYKTEIKRIKTGFENKIRSLKKAIKLRLGEYSDDYVKPGDVAIASQLRGIMLHKQLAKSLNNILAEKPTLSSYEDAVIALKTAQLSFDLFKVKDLIESSFGVGKVKDPVSMYIFRGTADYLKKAKQMIQFGLSVDTPIDIDPKLLEEIGQASEIQEDQSAFLKLLEKIKKTKAGKIALAPGKIALKLESLQWETLLPAYKVSASYDMWQKFKKKYPNRSAEDLGFKVADFTNSAFQGQNWEQLMIKHPWMTHNASRVLRCVVLGPDKLVSTFRAPLAAFALGEKGLGAKMYGGYLFKTFLAGTAITQLLNYLFNDHSTLENERGNEFSVEMPWMTDEKGNVLSFQVYGSAFEPIKFLNKPIPFLRNKRVGLVSSVMEIISPKYGTINWDRVGESITPLPINLQGVTAWSLGQIFDKDGEPEYGTPDKLVTALASVGLEFSGFPTVYRTGKSRDTSLMDVVKGDAVISDWLINNPYTQKKTKSTGIPTGIFGEEGGLKGDIPTGIFKKSGTKSDIPTGIFKK